MVDFKTDRQSAEWDEIAPTLKAAILLANAYAECEYGTTLVVTELNRTKEEQRQLYKDDPKFQAKPRISWHQTVPCKAVDFRYLSLSDEEWAELSAFVIGALRGLDMRVLLEPERKCVHMEVHRDFFA